MKQMYLVTYEWSLPGPNAFWGVQNHTIPISDSKQHRVTEDMDEILEIMKNEQYKSIRVFELGNLKEIKEINVNIDLKYHELQNIEKTNETILNDGQ